MRYDKVVAIFRHEDLDNFYTVKDNQILDSHGLIRQVLVNQSCLTLCDPMDCTPPDSSVHGILQARILEWVATNMASGNLLKGIFLTQGLNLDLLPCRQILYHLSHLGSQTLLEPESNNLPVVVTVYLLTHVHPFATLWTAAHQASLSFIISWNLLKLILSW